MDKEITNKEKVWQHFWDNTRKADFQARLEMIRNIEDKAEQEKALASFAKHYLLNIYENSPLMLYFQGCTDKEELERRANITELFRLEQIGRAHV